MICTYQQWGYSITTLKFWSISKPTSNVISVWNFDLRIFLVYGLGPKLCNQVMLRVMRYVLENWNIKGAWRLTVPDWWHSREVVYLFELHIFSWFLHDFNSQCWTMSYCLEWQRNCWVGSKQLTAAWDIISNQLSDPRTPNLNNQSTL